MKIKSSYIIPEYKEINIFRKKLTKWFKKNERKYPWRETDDPFRFLVAELMLRRTRADQVKYVYNNFFDKFPDIDSILESGENEINEVLYPLGMKKRFPVIQSLAQELKEKYNCSVPETREELIKLPGIGDYSAGALLSIMYRRREWMVDSNIVRLFKRYFGLETSKEGRRSKHIIELAKIFVSKGDPRNNNLALLDFAAVVCKPRIPRCDNCILSKTCVYNRES